MTCNAMGSVIHSLVAWVLRAVRKGFSVFKQCLNPPQPSHARYIAQVLPAHSRIHLLAMQNKPRRAIHHLDSFTCLWSHGDRRMVSVCASQPSTLYLVPSLQTSCTEVHSGEGLQCWQHHQHTGISVKWAPCVPKQK